MILNMSETGGDIQNQTTLRSTAVSFAFGGKSLVNFGLLFTKLDMWVWIHGNRFFSNGDPHFYPLNVLRSQMQKLGLKKLFGENF